MSAFYRDTVRRLMDRGTLTRDMRVLVVCGGKLDRHVLLECGLSDVTISNLDDRMTGDEFEPFAWSFQDAEQLDYAAGSFDFVIAHSGLHHCRSPQRGLLEMYRVARRGVLVFEPRDSFAVRLGVRIGVGQEYEHAAVFDNGCASAGLRNTEIPNYVFRWTEREIDKAIRSYAPAFPPAIEYFYATIIPWIALRARRNKLYLVAVTALLPLIRAVNLVYPKLCNHFGFLVIKPDPAREAFPWIRFADDTPRINVEWLNTRYAKHPRQPRPDRVETHVQTSSSSKVSRR